MISLPDTSRMLLCGWRIHLNIYAGSIIIGSICTIFVNQDSHKTIKVHSISQRTLSRLVIGSV
jgi:hypothetical protein